MPPTMRRRMEGSEIDKRDCNHWLRSPAVAQLTIPTNFGRMIRRWRLFHALRSFHAFISTRHSVSRRAFRQLHESGCFVIPDPSDPGSAKYRRARSACRPARTGRPQCIRRNYEAEASEVTASRPAAVTSWPASLSSPSADSAGAGPGELSLIPLANDQQWHDFAQVGNITRQ